MNQTTAHYRIVQTHESDDLDIWTHEGADPSGRLAVSFSSVGTDPGQVPPLEFPRLAVDMGRQHALFVVDKKRTWLNADGMVERVVDAIDAARLRFGVDAVVTMGNSMGAYNAALIAGFTAVDTALCYSPQASVHPDVAGDDLRWPLFRSAIAAHRFTGLADHLSDSTRYIAIYGDRPREAPQFRRFPQADNTHVLMLPDQGHGTAYTLKKLGLLREVMHLGMQGDPGGLHACLQTALGAYWRTPAQTGLPPVALPDGALQRALGNGERDHD